MRPLAAVIAAAKVDVPGAVDVVDAAGPEEDAPLAAAEVPAAPLDAAAPEVDAPDSEVEGFGPSVPSRFFSAAKLGCGCERSARAMGRGQKIRC